MMLRSQRIFTSHGGGFYYVICAGFWWEGAKYDAYYCTFKDSLVLNIYISVLKGLVKCVIQKNLGYTDHAVT